MKVIANYLGGVWQGLVNALGLGAAVGVVATIVAIIFATVEGIVIWLIQDRRNKKALGRQREELERQTRKALQKQREDILQDLEENRKKQGDSLAEMVLLVLSQVTGEPVAHDVEKRVRRLATGIIDVVIQLPTLEAAAVLHDSVTVDLVSSNQDPGASRKE